MFWWGRPWCWWLWIGQIDLWQRRRSVLLFRICTIQKLLLVRLSTLMLLRLASSLLLTVFLLPGNDPYLSVFDAKNDHHILSTYDWVYQTESFILTATVIPNALAISLKADWFLITRIIPLAQNDFWLLSTSLSLPPLCNVLSDVRFLRRKSQWFVCVWSCRFSVFLLAFFR